MKLSCIYMSNMSNVIKQHNCNILSTKNVDRFCSYINKDSCLLMVNVYKHTSFTKLMSSGIRKVISTMVLVMQNSNLDTITTKFILPLTSLTRHGTFKIYLVTTRQRHQLHPEMEYRSLCLDIQMWVKKV